MDDSRFDALARMLSSRRTTLAGVVGGVGALIGLANSEEAAAHDLMARCRSIPSGARRRACIRRAKAHRRAHRCQEQPPAAVCRGRCGGSERNACGKKVTCPLCPSGKVCLSNRGCAQSCDPDAPDPGCPTGCFCFAQDVAGGGRYCRPALVCETLPAGVCESTEACPPRHICAVTPCGNGGATDENRCVPLC